MIVTAYNISPKEKGDPVISELIHEVTDEDIGHLLVHKIVSLEILNDKGKPIQRYSLKLSRRGR